MKPSHLSTPRQLADCTFEVGHPEAQRPENPHPADIVVVVIATLGIVFYFFGVFG